MDRVVASLPLVRFLAALLAFVLPGYGWATWLHRSDRFGRPVRWALGFAWSFAVFGLIGWPFLWYGYSFAAFLSCLYPAWGLFALVGTVAYVQSRLSKIEDREPTEAPAQSSILNPRSSTGLRKAGLLLCLWVGLAAAAGCAWVWGEEWGRFGVVCAAPVLLFGGYLAARRFRETWGPVLEFTPEDDAPAPRLWTATAVGLILLQAVSSAVYYHPNCDDCFYLAAVLDYQHAEVLNDQDPTHREGFPMPVIHRTLCWELWGAVLCHVTGLSASAVFQSLLAGVMVLLFYAAYAALLAEYLPRRWLPLALLGLSAYHLWGISGQATAADHFLSRPWQGKAVLLHLAVPLTILLLTRYAARPSWRGWLSLTAMVVFGVAVSLSAVFMAFMLVACLTLGLLWTARGGRVRIVTGAVLSIVPLVLCGLAIRAAVQADAVMQVKATYRSPWLEALVLYGPYGSAEVIWLFSLPIVAALLGVRRRGVYLIVFPLLLGITFANPLLYDVVAPHVTSYYTYYRLWWLFPVGPGLAVLLALTVRFLCRTAFAGVRSAHLPLGLAAAGLVFSFALPGICIWSPRDEFTGPLCTPTLADNLDKLPPDLVPLAQCLAQDPEVRHGRVLCGDVVATFLAPYSRDFRFVQTRPMYTLYLFATAGKPREGLERHLLDVIRHHGGVPAEFDVVDWAELRFLGDDDAVQRMFGSPPRMPADLDVGTLLARYNVIYVLTDPTDQPGRVFKENGYRVVKQQGSFVLWQKVPKQFAEK
jgi:hypothetical protein